MGKSIRAAVLVLVAGALTVLVAPGPGAGASVAVSVGGTTVSVTATGEETVLPGCSGGSVTINGGVTSPRLACSALTKLSVSGDGGAQTVRGDTLTAATFAARPYLHVGLGGGDDVVVESPAADHIDTGAGDDRVVLSPAPGVVPNSALTLGPGFDTAEVTGTSGDDRMSVSGSGSTVVVSVEARGEVRTASVEAVEVTGGAGDDQIRSTDVAPGSLTTITLDGGDGDDALTAGAFGVRLVGGAGANTLLGGDGADTLVTASPSDVIRPGAGANVIVDGSSPRVGGRTIHGTAGAADSYAVEQPALDSVVRVRPLAGGASVTASLARPGRQDLGPTFTGAAVTVAPGRNTRHLVDIVLSPGTSGYMVTGDEFDDDLVDVTVPTGGWTSRGTPSGLYTLSPSAAGYGSVVVANVGQVSVHGPWTDADRGFAHRAHRDLLFRFVSASARDAIADRLAIGAATRAQIVSELTETDEYRGLDVDRVFATYLRRPSDAAGRAYWIGRIRTGTALWRFRAQVFGSGEYFANAGGTNVAYVRAAYMDVLGRQPDPSGLAYWVSRLQAGTARGTVALQFLNSSEARRRIVDDQFLRFVDRPATASEHDTWVPRISLVGGEQALIRFLAASASYYART